MSGGGGLSGGFLHGGGSGGNAGLLCGKGAALRALYYGIERRAAGEGGKGIGERRHIEVGQYVRGNQSASGTFAGCRRSAGACRLRHRDSGEASQPEAGCAQRHRSGIGGLHQ